MIKFYHSNNRMLGFSESMGFIVSIDIDKLREIKNRILLFLLPKKYKEIV